MRARPIATTRTRDFRRMVALTGGAVLVALGAWAGAARAQDEVIRSHGVSIFGELKYGPEFQHFDYVNPEAPKGGTMSTWAFGTFDSLSPYILKGNAAALSSVFFESMMTGTLDEPDSMYGLLAESIEYPESREWVIFHMRPEARFSDGTPVTAADAVFSYNVLLEKGAPVYKVILKDFESVEALDEHTVKYTFKPEGALKELLMTAAGLPVFSEAYYSEVDFAEATLEPPVGSGEYALLSVDPGRSVSYQRREDYWGKDLPVNIGQNNFDVLKVEYFADYTTAFEAFKGGAYAFREEFQSKLWGTAYNFPAIEDGTIKVETLPDGRPAGTQGFWFNLRREKFQDPRVREAIGLAYNFEWANESLFYGLYDRTDSFWENSPTLQASGMPTEAELALLEPLREHLPETVFTEEAFVPPVQAADTVADRRSLRQAGRLLDEAGWTVGDDGLRRNAAGEVLEVQFLNDSPSFDRIVNPFVENLGRLGIRADATRVDAAESQEREKTFDYDIVTQRYSMSQTPGDELRQIFGSDTASVEGSANTAGLSNPAIDALIQHIIDADSREELTTAVHALDRSLRAMHIWVPQWYKGVHNIAYLDMFDRPYTDNPPPKGLGEMSLWWVNPEKEQALRDAGAL
ncbi:extracellular solute-binding protein [Mesobacterium pallidum]|uniref:extracellular solute-binding protein n=1 Tax=Mesobacterium pallidum TaxID=2872037 RepID=UPI001EE37A4A|nr:extracellular solute-binding protein [Mesobacterium pallidum]